MQPRLGVAAPPGLPSAQVRRGSSVIRSGREPGRLETKETAQNIRVAAP